MNQDTDTQKIPYTQIDPKVERYFIVKPGDVVVFKFSIQLSRDLADDIRAQVEPKMGDIPFLIVGPETDLTVLRPDITRQAFIA